MFWATQHPLAIGAFLAVGRRNPQLLCHFIRQENSQRGRSEHHIRLGGGAALGEHLAECFDMRWVAQDMELLKVCIRVTTTREHKVPLEQRTTLRENLKNIGIGHASEYTRGAVYFSV